MIDTPELKTNFLFRDRPLAIPGDLRPAWRIGLLVLLIRHCCRGGKTSIARLHVLNWAMRSKRNKTDLEAAIGGDFRPERLIVRFDPFLNRALDFAIGEGLIYLEGGKSVVLTPDGVTFANELDHEESLYKTEKQFIVSLKQRLTETLVNQMFQRKE